MTKRFVVFLIVAAAAGALMAQSIPGFGKPQSESDYQLARTFRVSLGLKF